MKISRNHNATSPAARGSAVAARVQSGAGSEAAGWAHRRVAIAANPFPSLQLAFAGASCARSSLSNRH